MLSLEIHALSQRIEAGEGQKLNNRVKGREKA